MRDSLWPLRRIVCAVRGHDFEPSGWCARRCGATTEPTREVASWWFAPLPDGGSVTMIRYTDGTEERHEESSPPGYAVPEPKPLRAEDGWQSVGYTEDYGGGSVSIAPAGTPPPGNDITPQKVVTPEVVRLDDLPEHTVLSPDVKINVPDHQIPLTRYVDGDRVIIGTADVELGGPDGWHVTVHPWERYAYLTDSADQYSIGFTETDGHPAPYEAEIIPPQRARRTPTEETVTLPEPIDPGRFTLDAIAPVFTTTVRLGRITTDEGIRNAVAYIGTVHLASVPIHSERTLGHVGADPAHVERHAREAATAGFAVHLAKTLGYDPYYWEDQ